MGGTWWASAPRSRRGDDHGRTERDEDERPHCLPSNVDPDGGESCDPDHDQKSAEEQGQLTRRHVAAGRAAGCAFMIGKDDRRDEVEDDHREDAGEQPQHQSEQSHRGRIRTVVLGDPATYAGEDPIAARSVEPAGL